MHQIEMARAISLATIHVALATSSPAAGVARVDDSAVTTTGTIPTWQSCSASDECVPLAYACSFTAANRKRLSDAKAHLRAKGLDPAYFECARQDSSELQTIPQCVQARCGLWRPANTGETTGAGR